MSIESSNTIKFELGIILIEFCISFTKSIFYIKDCAIFGYYGLCFLWNLYNHKSSKNSKKAKRNFGAILKEVNIRTVPKFFEIMFKV
jgi:hypothetical protein